MVFTDVGMKTEVRAEHAPKVQTPMAVTEVGMNTEVRAQ